MDQVSLVNKVAKVNFISIWIFLVPFIGINTCLILITQFHGLFPNQEDVILNTFPYLDGGASISRTARPYPTWLIFKPTMFLTSYLLVKYWIYNKNIIEFFSYDHKYQGGLGSSSSTLVDALMRRISKKMPHFTE